MPKSKKKMTSISCTYKNVHNPTAKELAHEHGILQASLHEHVASSKQMSADLVTIMEALTIRNNRLTHIIYEPDMGPEEVEKTLELLKATLAEENAWLKKQLAHLAKGKESPSVMNDKDGVDISGIAVTEAVDQDKGNDTEPKSTDQMESGYDAAYKRYSSRSVAHKRQKGQSKAHKRYCVQSMDHKTFRCPSKAHKRHNISSTAHKRHSIWDSAHELYSSQGTANKGPIMQRIGNKRQRLTGIAHNKHGKSKAYQWHSNLNVVHLGRSRGTKVRFKDKKRSKGYRPRIRLIPWLKEKTEKGDVP